MLKQETRVIDGLSFTTTQFPALKACVLQGELMKMGPVFEVFTSDNINADMLAAFDPDKYAALIQKMLANTSVILSSASGQQNVTLNTEANINLAFMGRLPTMMKVFNFAVEVNFANFTDGSAPSAP